jgi:hypothetical protein
MHRRDVFRAVSAGLALPTLGALAPDELWAAARSMHQRIHETRQGETLLILDGHQNALVTALAELIIPQTDTPGATAAQVNRFVDFMLAEWFEAEDREEFLRDLDALDTSSSNTFGAPFLTLDAEQQAAVLRRLDEEVTALREAGRPTQDRFFSRMKWLTLYGYYSSQVGATEELQQVIIPGGYEACAPVRRGGAGQWQ